MIATKINNRLRSNWLKLRPVRATKIVGIGLPKTGTTSLGYCFRRFGFKHQTYDMDLALKVKRNQIDEVLSVAEKHESFEDWPWFLLYKEFDRRFPNSKFILTLRTDTATYVRSLQGHHEREGIRKADWVKPHWWDEVHGMQPAEWDYEYSARRYENHSFGEKITLIISDSISAAQLFSDASLEWVHLDARHDYASVKADIEAWLPKVRVGGWLSGDDYDEQKWPEVVKAVSDTLPRASSWSNQQWRHVGE